MAVFVNEFGAVDIDGASQMKMRKHPIGLCGLKA